MFRRGSDHTPDESRAPDRVDSVLGPGLTWQGDLSGSGGIRIEGAFEGDIHLHGLVVVGDQGRLTCHEIHAVTVVVAGSVKGNIQAQRLEIMGTGRVWGDVTTVALSTEEGAFLRGQITREEKLDLGFGPDPVIAAEPDEESSGGDGEEDEASSQEG
jgi:cytoskeletal protein CcmA (bactofilin family)